MQGRLMRAEGGQVKYNIAPSRSDGQGSILSLGSCEAVSLGHSR